MEPADKRCDIDNAERLDEVRYSGESSQSMEPDGQCSALGAAREPGGSTSLELRRHRSERQDDAFGAETDVKSAGLYTRHTLSAGGVLVRRAGNTIEVLVGQRAVDVSSKWSPTLIQLPKGSVGDGELIEQAALREVLEETGYEACILLPAGIAEWSYDRSGFHWHEEVHYFLMLVQGHRCERDREFDSVRWLPLDTAVQTLSYPQEKQIARGVAQDVASIW